MGAACRVVLALALKERLGPGAGTLMEVATPIALIRAGCLVAIAIGLGQIVWFIRLGIVLLSRERPRA